MYDIPATIDYIVKTTGREKIFYLGHSQGTTAFFVMSSERPEYQDKIQAMFALAPVAYLGRINNPVLQFIARFTGPLSVRNSNLSKIIIAIAFLCFINFNSFALMASIGTDEINRFVRVRTY